MCLVMNHWMELGALISLVLLVILKQKNLSLLENVQVEHCPVEMGIREDQNISLDKSIYSGTS